MKSANRIYLKTCNNEFFSIQIENNIVYYIKKNLCRLKCKQIPIWVTINKKVFYLSIKWTFQYKAKYVALYEEEFNELEKWLNKMGIKLVESRDCE